jgi:hypothetical protein
MAAMGDEFPDDYQEDVEETSVPVFTGSGEKGVAKTAGVLSFRLAKTAFSYDGKVSNILRRMFPEEIPRTTVIDAMHYIDYDQEKWTESADKTHRYLLASLERAKPKDGSRGLCIIHDGLDVLAEIEEMRMRFKMKLKPFQGFAERTNWKIRGLGLREILLASEQAVQRNGGGAVVFLTYPRRTEVYENGVLVETQAPPKWYDWIEKRSDVWMEFRRQDARAPTDRPRFLIYVRTDKLSGWAEGKSYDVTGKKAWDVLPITRWLPEFLPQTPVGVASDVPAAPPAPVPANGGEADPFA